MSFSAYLSRGGGADDTVALDLDSLVDSDDLSSLLDSSADFLDDGLCDRDEVDELDALTRSCLPPDPSPNPADDEPPYLHHPIDPYHSQSPSATYAASKLHPHLDEGDRFDWASSAALAILPSPSASTATTAVSSQTSSPAPSPSRLRRSPQAEDKVEPHSPEPFSLTPSIPSSAPSSIAPILSPLTRPLTSSASLQRLSSSLSSRVTGLCASIVDCVSSSLYTQELMESVTALRQLLSTRSPTPFTVALSTPILPAFVSILHHPTASPQLLMEVAWCLTNLASGSSEQVDMLVEAGVIDGLLAHLRPGVTDAVLVQQVVWALGNIAGDNWQHRDLLLDKGCMRSVCGLSEAAIGSSPELLRHLCWTIHNLCRNKPPPVAARVAVCIPTVKRLLLGEGGAVAAAAQDPELMPDLLWTLSCLSESCDSVRSRLLQDGFLDYVMGLLSSLESLSLVRLTPAIRTVGNFLMGTEQETQLVLDRGFIPLLSRLLHYPLEQVRKEACWAASNVAAGSRAQKQRLFDEPGLLDEVIALSEKGNGSVRKEATWVLCNLCEDAVNDHMIDALIAKGLLRVLTASLLHPSEQIYTVAAAGLVCILRGHDRLRSLDACKEADAAIRAEQLRCLRRVQAVTDTEPSDELLAPSTWEQSVEEEWNEMMAELRDKGEVEEVDRLTAMRNVRLLIHHKGDEEDDLHAGEERRREEEDEDGEERSSPSSGNYPL